MTEKTTYGNRIKSRRLELGLERREVAEATGLPRGYIADIENDKFKHPSFKKMQAIAEVLQTDVYEMVGIEGFKRQCKNCRFLETGDKLEGYGLCHRYPPLKAPNRNPLSFEFPVVNIHWWCGEWRPKIIEVDENETSD